MMGARLTMHEKMIRAIASSSIYSFGSIDIAFDTLKSYDDVLMAVELAARCNRSLAVVSGWVMLSRKKGRQ